MPDSEFDALSVATRVRELMERHGIGERKQSSKLAEILEMGYSEAHRKMQGKGVWTITHLAKVAQAFDEPVGALIGATDHAKTSSAAVCRDATLSVGVREFPCLAWVGDVVSAAQRPELVAIHTIGNDWRIVDAMIAPPGILYAVEKIEIRPRPLNRPKVAIVDDERDSADAMRDYLNEVGYQATAFYSPEGVRDAMRGTHFDAYVIDWMLGDETSEGLVRHIRAVAGSGTPIMLLTGKLVSGQADQSELGRAMVRFNLLWHEKPAKQAIIVAELKKALA
jgi:CheY-like chemotaxis protein